MKIAFIGYGSMAVALATKWQNHDHTLFFAGRDAQRAKAVADQFQARSGTMPEALAFADVVVLATRHEDVFTAIEAAGGAAAFEGKTVIDINNPVSIETFTTTRTDGRSLTEALADALPGAMIIKAFNMAQARVWSAEDMSFDGRPMVTLYTADTPKAVETGAALIRDVGAQPLHIGDKAHAYQLEAAAALVIQQLFAGRPSDTILNFILTDEKPRM